MNDPEFFVAELASAIVILTVVILATWWGFQTL